MFLLGAGYSLRKERCIKTSKGASEIQASVNHHTVLGKSLTSLREASKLNQPEINFSTTLRLRTDVYAARSSFYKV